MQREKVYRAIGLMSGTSLDGVIDVALIETDGHEYVKTLDYYEHPYDIEVRDKVRACFGKYQPDAQIRDAEDMVTDIHIRAVTESGFQGDLIGFHGQTVTHDPAKGFTWQLGDGARLARETGMDVVYDLRQNDVAHGGQGAPIIPLYHKALLANNDRPAAILNLGGVANITYIGAHDDIMAFDCGPANALMDDFIKLRENLAFDKDGRKAALGNVLETPLKIFKSDDFFKQAPPKSLDRNHWGIDCVHYATTEDGMATLMEMSIHGVLKAMEFFPAIPKSIYLAGGGRHNRFMADSLAQRLNLDVFSIDDLGWNGDAIEAQGMAYLAVRSVLGLPITLTATTGASQDLTGGVLAKAA